jgi:hypothetical protein
MRTRLFTLTLVLCSIVAATCARAAVGKWEPVSYDKWGFTLQLPAGAQKQAVSDQPQQGFYDVYSVGQVVCVVAVTPGQENLPASTVIEQVLQGEVKKAAKLGPAKRWEQDSKKGDLFKGLTGLVQLKGADYMPAVVGKIVAGDTGFECISMATLGDETSPILNIGVIGPKNHESEVTAMAKSMAALVSRTQAGPPPPPVVVSPPKKVVPEVKPVPSVNVQEPTKLVVEPKPTPPPKPNPRPNPIPKPAPRPIPKPSPKPWPVLKQGQIELAGVVDAISADRRSVTVIVDTVTMPGQNPIDLSPARSKKVMLRQKLSWLAPGQRIRLLGKNTGIGKPMTADSLEKALDKPAGLPNRTGVSVPA